MNLCRIENLFLDKPVLKFFRDVENVRLLHFALTQNSFEAPEDSSQWFNLPSRLKSIKHVHFENSNLKMLKVKKESKEENKQWTAMTQPFSSWILFSVSSYCIKESFCWCTFFQLFTEPLKLLDFGNKEGFRADSGKLQWESKKWNKKL